jgi:GDPmannose 4,6-dehydratase
MGLTLPATTTRGDMTRRAFITGITGQDGSYLAELLLDKGYEVHGLIRRASTFNTSRIDHLYVDPHEADARLFLYYGDLTDASRLVTLLKRIDPHEVYHLGAQSHVRVSFDEPEHTGDVTGLSTTRLLEAIRDAEVNPRFYQASSSEMFGAAPPPQNEDTPFQPRSPYAAAKVYAYWVTRTYREAYGMHAVNGILFNHESPRRGETFVTRKITRAAARIAAGLQDTLYLGNLDATRDWGYAPEYVDAMWRMLHHDTPDDFVIATGVGHTVRDFLTNAFDHVGLDWQRHIHFDERYLRPTEVKALVGDPSQAAQALGWKAHVHAPELARLMVEAELGELRGHAPPASSAQRQHQLPRPYDRTVSTDAEADLHGASSTHDSGER